MIGTRRDNPESAIPKAGEYGRDANGDWFGMTPDGMLAGLRLHDVVEHEDGTITVSPSILVSGGSHNDSWHGYLERGVWREA
jgi:hypothetical protein